MKLEELPLLFPLWLLYMFSAAAIGAVLVALASAATAAARRWQHTERLGFLSTVVSIAVVCSAMLAIMVLHTLGPDDTADAFTATLRLGHSVKLLIQATGPAVPAAVIGALMWVLARRQGLHHPGHSGPPVERPTDTPSSRPRS